MQPEKITKISKWSKSGETTGNDRELTGNGNAEMVEKWPNMNGKWPEMSVKLLEIGGKQPDVVEMIGNTQKMTENNWK